MSQVKDVLSICCECDLKHNNNAGVINWKLVLEMYLSLANNVLHLSDIYS